MDRGKRKGKRRAALLFVFVCAAGVLLAGCGATSSDDAASYAIAGSAAENEAAVEETMAAPAEGAVSGGSGQEMLDSVSAPSAELGTTRESGNIEDAGGAENTASEAEKPDNAERAERKLIKDVNMSVETKNLDSLIKSVEEKTESLGGYIESSYIRGNEWTGSGEARYASIEARIPADRLDEFLDTALTDANIIYKNERVTDITLKYTDTESRIKALNTEYDRLMELLSRAESVESIIALEERLSEIRYELENYNSQIRLYDNQISYSTVTIDISEVSLLTAGAKAGFMDRVSSGFMKNVEGVAEFLENALIAVLSLIPVLIPLGILGVVIAGIMKKAEKRRRLGKTEKTKKEVNEKNGKDCENNK